MVELRHCAYLRLRERARKADERPAPQSTCIRTPEKLHVIYIYIYI